MKLLLTAFDPFGGSSVNPALEAVKLVADRIGDMEIVKLEVPTVFGKSVTTVAAKMAEVKALPLDLVLAGARVDYIKYDVEGAEREAIEGSRETILSHRPALLVSAYHKSEDIFALPLQIHTLRPDYKLYYRRYPYIPAWDLNLICIQ